MKRTLIPGFPALASPGAAHWGVGRAAGGGGEARGETSLLGDVRGMCSSAGNFWKIAVIYEIQGKYEEGLEMHRKSLDIKTRRVRGRVLIAGWSLGGVGPNRVLRGGERVCCLLVLNLVSSTLPRKKGVV